jgi:hypothetical protein
VHDDNCVCPKRDGLSCEGDCPTSLRMLQWAWSPQPGSQRRHRGELVLGTPRADGSAGLLRPHLAPLPLLAGLVAVMCCDYLAAVYLSRDAEPLSPPPSRN